MERPKIGSVVISLKGNDTGKIMMVIGADSGHLLVSDGKKRKISSPKRKNFRHVKILCQGNELMSVDTELTDGKLRRFLARFREEVDAEKFRI